MLNACKDAMRQGVTATTKHPSGPHIGMRTSSMRSGEATRQSTPSTHASVVSTSCHNRRTTQARCTGARASAAPHAAGVRRRSAAVHARPQLPRAGRAPHADVDAVTSTHAGRGSLGLGPPRSCTAPPAAAAPSAGCAAAGAGQEEEALGAPGAAAARVPPAAGSGAAGCGTELPGSAAHPPLAAAAGPASCPTACTPAKADDCPGTSPAQAAAAPAELRLPVLVAWPLGGAWPRQRCAAAPACAVLAPPGCECPWSPGPDRLLPGSPSTGLPTWGAL